MVNGASLADVRSLLDVGGGADPRVAGSVWCDAGSGAGARSPRLLGTTHI